MQTRHVLDITDLSVEECLDVLQLAAAIRANPQDYLDACRGKILAKSANSDSTISRECSSDTPLTL